jgi:hypothetical protein
MKKLLFVLIFCSVNTFAGVAEFKLSKSIFNNSTLPFISHQGSGPFDSYLTMEIQFEPVAELFRQLLVLKRMPLTSRGESHITVITPVEFNEVLKAKLSMNEINVIAKKANVQSATFETVCVGKRSLEIDKKLEQTFYVIVRSNDLVKIRDEVQKLFIKKGGDAGLFKPKQFYPHITLGFTKRDLHESDGVTKDERSCFGDLSLVK